MAARDPEERSLIARLAAAERWGRTPDRSAATQAARDARLAHLAEKADPEHKLSEPERLAAAERLRRAHMLKMSLRAKQARARRKAEPAETVAKPIPLRRRQRPAHPRPDDRGAA